MTYKKLYFNAKRRERQEKKEKNYGISITVLENSKSGLSLG